jgi:cell division protein FtsL
MSEFLAFVLFIALAWLAAHFFKLKHASEADKKKIDLLQLRKSELETEIQPLLKYKVIQDAEKEAWRVRHSAESEAERLREEVKAEVKTVRLELREAVQKSKERSEHVVRGAIDESRRIIETARARAEQIAGDAYEAKENAEHYAQTAQAMKNVIQGYGDEYLVPNTAALDDLAEEFSHKDAGIQLKQARLHVKQTVTNGLAAECDYAESTRRLTAIHFVLDAFNGKSDSILSKVRHDNYGKLRQELTDAFHLVNNNGQAFRNARISPDYLALRLAELKWAVAVNELKLQEREEQRAIKEAIREEEKARKEYEKAIKDAEKEERLLKKAMLEAESKLKTAHDEERQALEAQLQELQKKYDEAEERNQRAISMAQQTRTGHVYIISNVGSFGENVYKIGMTRRLEPLDRVKELGDASVPFEFDVHAMIHSKDAPALETELHTIFNERRLNKINTRKEFFNVQLSEIKNLIDGRGIETHWTMKAEATQYRESLAIGKSTKDELAII